MWEQNLYQKLYILCYVIRWFFVFLYYEDHCVHVRVCVHVCVCVRVCVRVCVLEFP